MQLEEPKKHINKTFVLTMGNFHNKPRKERTNQGHKSILGLVVNEKFGLLVLHYLPFLLLVIQHSYKYTSHANMKTADNFISQLNHNIR